MFRALNDNGFETEMLNDAGNAEAVALAGIGDFYFKIYNSQSALKFLNGSALIFRANGDKHCEAVVLNYIGLVYGDLGEKQQALNFYNESLLLRRALGKKRAEALSLIGISKVCAGDDVGGNGLSFSANNRCLLCAPQRSQGK